jgi:hypothetical protein
MSVASRPLSTGKTRTCPHCKATILESLSICPGCMHHLRFDSEAAKRQVAAAPALRVEGIIRHPPLEPPLEYYVIIAVRNDRGEEVTRQVVNVGALQAAEKRTFTLSVEVLPPQAPVPTKSTSSTGTFKSPIPQPTATVRPSTPPTAPAPGTTAAAPSSPTSGASSASSVATSPASGAGPGRSASSVPLSSSPSAPSTRPTAGASASGARPATNPATPAGQPLSPQPPGAARQTPSTSSSAPNASKPPGFNNPKPATPGNPSTPSSDVTKPTSGYTLKPPNPGGPKRH